MIYAGGGIIASNASGELVDLAERFMIPITTTLMGIGCIPCDHPLNLGMLGMHGTEYANFAITECDLLLAIGVRFDDRVTGKISTFAPNAKIIHIDVDPAEIGKNKPIDVPIVGDARAVLQVMLQKIQKRGGRENWLEKIRLWKKKHPLKYKDDGKLRPQYIIQQLLRPPEGRGDHRLRGRAESDVDRPGPLLQEAEVMAHLRGPRDHGLWLSCLDGRPLRPAG